MGKYKVSEEDCRGIFVEVANVVFDQDWKLESDLAGETKAVKVPTGRNDDGWLTA